MAVVWQRPHERRTRMPWRRVEQMLADWRAAERRLAELAPDSAAWGKAREEVRARKAAYEAAVAEAMLVNPQRRRDAPGEVPA
jgi:hypothetical protein